jgi:hypothetical protein
MSMSGYALRMMCDARAAVLCTLSATMISPHLTDSGVSALGR